MSAAELAAALGGYLCGTRLRADDPRTLAAGHRALERASVEVELFGAEPWIPGPESRALRDALHAALAVEGIVDLVVFGSQARGTATGFSDLDAVLVLEDAAVEDAGTLRRLRGHVLAAQRAVQRHQPLQHHGFDTATPALLAQAGDALPFPRVVLAEARSLRGRGLRASFAAEPPGTAARRFAALAAPLLAAAAWPAHPWRAHRLAAMFELAPALFVQALGREVPKWQSFAAAREELDGAEWAYDELGGVRERWPRRRRRMLELAAAAARNPWLAVALWRRLPSRGRFGLLTPSLLAGLQRDVRAMQERLA